MMIDLHTFFMHLPHNTYVQDLVVASLKACITEVHGFQTFKKQMINAY